MAYRRSTRRSSGYSRSTSSRRRTTTRRRRSGGSRVQKVVIQLVGPQAGPGSPSPMTLGKKGNLPLSAKY